MPRKILLAFLLIALAPWCFGSASNIYITEAGSPTGNCTSNVQTPSFFNNSANWGSGSNQIGPGTTVLICGTFTGSAGDTEFTFQGSGASGSPITLKFDTGAVLTSPAWSSQGAISCSNKQFIVVDGGTDGLITNTANGTSLSYRQASGGVQGNSCYNSTVKNLSVSHIYMNEGSSSSASDTNGANTYDIQFNSTSTNNIVAGNRVSSAKTAISIAADPGDGSNVQIYGNMISDMDWGINVGGGDTTTTVNNLSVHNNTITNWTNWQFPTNSYHQDGIIIYNQGNPSAGITAAIYNNYVYGDLGVGSPTGFIFCTSYSTCTIFNNLLVNTGHPIYGIMWLGSAGATEAKSMYVYNNTIVGLSQDSGITLAITGQATIENNIVVGVHDGIHDYGNLTTDVAISNYNVWQNSSGGAPAMATDDSTSINYSSWQTDGFDGASSTADPKLDGSYHLGAGSSAAGLGANLTSLNNSDLNKDMSGNGRPSSSTIKWDAGVYNININAPGTPINLGGVLNAN